jgi:regulator of sigma E protease
MMGLVGSGSLWDHDAWDSVSLNDYLRQAAVAGSEVELTVQRSAEDEEPAQPVTITVQPRVPTEFLSVLPAGSPMSASTIGIAYRIENRVAAVLPDSPAADAGIKPGDRVTTVKILLPRDSSGTARDPIVVDFVPQQPGGLARLFSGLFGGEVEPAVGELNWPMLIDAAQQTPAGTQFEFLFERDNKVADVTMALATGEGFFVPERGFIFSPIELTMRADSFGEQLRLGWEETADALTMVYRFLQKIGTQVPVTALGGPVTIAKAAGYSASEGVAQLLIFLTMLSANLAVINFLPIPLLDGGHMVFLAWEGIRGRPASEKFVLALHTVGFVFIISLMLFVIALDVGLIPRGL